MGRLEDQRPAARVGSAAPVSVSLSLIYIHTDLVHLEFLRYNP